MNILVLLGLLIPAIPKKYYVRRKNMDNMRVFRFEEREVANILCQYAEMKFGLENVAIDSRAYEIWKYQKKAESGDTVKTGFILKLTLKDGVDVSQENEKDGNVVRRLIQMEETK